MSKVDVATPLKSRNLGLIFAAAVAIVSVGLVAWLGYDRTRLATALASRVDELTETRARLAASEAALLDKEVALIEATKPALPLVVTFRAAWTGSGKVVQIHNTSPQAISVVATLTDPRVGLTKTFTLAIDGNVAVEIGHSEGWPVTPGQSLSITANGYRDLTLLTP